MIFHNTTFMKTTALFLFAFSGIVNLVFLFSNYYGFVEAILPTHAYVEAVIDICVRVVLLIGLYKQSRGLYYAAVWYVVLVSIYIFVELLFVPIKTSTPLYIASSMLLNAAILYSLNQVITARIEAPHPIIRHIARLILCLGVFFLTSYFLNTIVAVATVVSLVVATRNRKPPLKP